MIMIKNITLFIFIIFTKLITAQSVAIGTSDLFDVGPNATWVQVITLTTVADGAASRAAQTLEINITNLPAGAQYRVYKTTANGGSVFGNAQDLVMGNNTITVNAVAFDRAVKIQFDNETVQFDMLVINGETLYDGDSNGGGGTGEEACIGTSDLFDVGPNATWVQVITLTTVADGAASRTAQTLEINIINLPAGAQYRVYKTTANGSDFFGTPTPLTLGINTITVNAVAFDRAVKIQFNDGGVCFSSLFVNGNNLYPGGTNDCIGTSDLFDVGPNATWVQVITLTTVADGAASGAAQTLEINITNLPAGAQYRVYKTTANGGSAFGNAQDLVMGNNTITVNAVAFDRTVKIQFNDGGVCFSSLSVNGVELGLEGLSFSDLKIFPNPATNIIFVDRVQNIKSIKVYSILGSLEKEVFNTNQVDIYELSTGIHLIKVDNGIHIISKQIIKQ
jgi:hypothetical protein